MTAPNLLESSEQAELYLRGSDTLLASWEAYARGATGATVQRRDGREGPAAWAGHRADRRPVYDARARACRTASLQSTRMAERVYAAVGFRDLGRILEYVPMEGER
jgi:hypothetical protein